VAKFLARHGEGVYKIGYRVSDCGAAVDHIKEVGGRLLGEAPQHVGSERVEAFAFLHPKGSLGTLVELVQRTDREGGL
jgi:methylmalonyl-CoA/ethylmalonyl-CoA epimerase